MEKAWQIIWIDEAKSSNEWVESHIGELANLSVVAVLRQTGGRGSGHRLWHSEPGANLTFTIFLRHSERSGQAACSIRETEEAISLSTAAAVCDYLQSKGIQPWIKLPNDVWVGDRKICGLLIRHRVRGGRILHSVIGIGLNLGETDFPADLPNPTSVCLETGYEKPDPRAELPLLLEYVAARLLAAGEFHRPDCSCRIGSLEH